MRARTLRVVGLIWGALAALVLIPSVGSGLQVGWDVTIANAVDGLRRIGGAAPDVSPAQVLLGISLILIPVLVVMGAALLYLGLRPQAAPSASVGPGGADLTALVARPLVETPQSHSLVGNEAGVAPRTMCERTPKQLLTRYLQGATEIQAQQLIDRYMGQWREVSGRVATIRAHGSDLIVLTLIDPDDVTVVFLFNQPTSTGKLSELLPDEPIKVIGRLYGVGKYLVSFDDAELVE